MFSVSVIKRPDSKSWYLAWRDGTGKLHRRSANTRDKALARQIANKIERELVQVANGLPCLRQISWDQAVREFLADVKSRSKPLTVDSYRRVLAVFAREIRPTTSIVTLAQVTDFIAARRKKVVTKTVNKDLRTIRAFIRWLAERRYLETVPRIKLLREDQQIPVAIPTEHRVKIRAAIEQVPYLCLGAAWWQDYLACLEATGARRNEVRDLTWGNVDLDRAMMTITATTSKSRRDRVVPIPPELVERLAARRESVTGSRVFPYRFTSPRQLHSDWDRIRKQADLSYRLKDYRSTCGSDLAAAGVPTAVVQNWLGHANISTTAKYYTDTRPALRKALSALEEYRG